jgi:hypothetical protein
MALTPYVQPRSSIPEIAAERRPLNLNHGFRIMLSAAM